MNNINVATARSGANATVAAILAWLLFTIFGWEIAIDNPLFIGIVGVVYTAFYRISRLLADRFDWLGYLFFGVKKQPTY